MYALVMLFDEWGDHMPQYNKEVEGEDWDAIERLASQWEQECYKENGTVDWYETYPISYTT